MLYVPHYTEKTSIRKGELPSANDISARSNLMREKGLRCVGEVWHFGFVPLYEGAELTTEEKSVLCLDNYSPKV